MANSLNRFVTRYAIREVFKNDKTGFTESYIRLTEDKTICNNSEEYKFYAKIGGVLNLEDIDNQKIKELIEKLDFYGFYLVINQFEANDNLINCALTVPHFKYKAIEDEIKPLVSFIPRINGRSGAVICSLRIDMSMSVFANT